MLRRNWFSADVKDKIHFHVDEAFTRSQVTSKILTPFTKEEALSEPEYPEDRLGAFYDRFKIAYE